MSAPSLETTSPDRAQVARSAESDLDRALNIFLGSTDAVVPHGLPGHRRGLRSGRCGPGGVAALAARRPDEGCEPCSVPDHDHDPPRDQRHPVGSTPPRDPDRVAVDRSHRPAQDPTMSAEQARRSRRPWPADGEAEPGQLAAYLLRKVSTTRTATSPSCWGPASRTYGKWSAGPSSASKTPITSGRSPPATPPPRRCVLGGSPHR